MTSTTRVGLNLSEAVLGSGMLLVLPIALSLAGRAAPATWLVVLAGGATFSLTFAMLALVRTGAGSIADVSGAVLGRWARQTVLVVYIGGFTVGQAAIALGAGGFLAEALHSPGRSVDAVALLVAATTGAVAGVELGGRGRGWRLGVTGVLAALACAHPTLFVGAGLLQLARHRNVGAAAFLLLFAGVGWEVSARLAPSLGSRGRVVWAVALGAGLVTAVYLPLALVLRARTNSGAGPAPRLVALAAAVVLGLYCLTGIRSAARMVSILGGPDRPWVSLAIGGASVGAVLAALAFDSGVAGLLVVPCLAAWIGYFLATAAIIRGGSPGTRFVGAALLAGLSVLLLRAGTALV
jgi:hypothetical protein